VFNPSEISAVYAQGEAAVLALVQALYEQNAQLSARILALENQLKKDSHNSSKPPSGDGFGKRTKSLRRKGERQSGGQPDHPGQTLEWSNAVDETVVHAVTSCCVCGEDLSRAPVERMRHRQVQDLPPLELAVTEHQGEVKRCPACGVENQANFPAEAHSPVQYGPRLKGLMVYLQDAQLIPSGRTAELLREVFGATLSEATLYASRTQAFEDLAELSAAIESEIVHSDVVHFDETGLRVNGTLWWLHVACTSGLTTYFVHRKRGRAAMDEMGILPNFSGNAVHDAWASYQGYRCRHSPCNAHHLRELTFVWERFEQAWAFQMSVLLSTIHRQVEAAKAEGQTALAPEQVSAFEDRYQAIITAGLEANPPPPPPPPDTPKKRGRAKQSTAKNLLDRLQSRSASVLGFLYDFEVPFDNNQAERDLRMMKLKQKISGCFRTEAGAQMFCRVRGYISTLRKQGIDLFDALVSLFMGDPVSPVPETK
jgi:transposase